MAKKILKKIKLNSSLFIYISLALIPLMFVTVFVIQMTSATLSKNSQSLIEYQTNHVVDMFNEETDSLLEVFYSTMTDHTLTSLCSKFSHNQEVEYTISLLKDQFNFYMNLSPTISQCVFISMDGRYTTAQHYRSNTSATEWQNEEYRNSVLTKIIGNGNLSIFPAHEINNSYSSSPVFYVGIPYGNTNKDDKCGVLIFGIQKSFFSSAFFETKSNSGNRLPEILQFAQLILTDQDETIIYASDVSMIGYSLQDYTEKYSLTKTDYVRTKYTIDKTNWAFFSYSPRTIVFASVTKALKLLYILIAIYACFLIYACIVIVSHQNRRIRAIADGIQNFKGNEKGYRIPLFSNEHLNIIITEFNLMADRVSDLTENLKSEQKKNQEEINLRRKAELKTLEAQINPHFLYNTLDTINWMAITNGEMEISTMLGTLGSLLRYSVTNIDSPVLIKAEIEWIKKYLYLQNKRFRDLFTYEIHIAPDVENLTIYKMLLQPLIENSIIHGFAKITTGGFILIEMYPADNRLFISITDNGCGLTPEKLLQFQEMAANPSTYTGKNIGFFNVVSRLRAYYKDQFHIEITSGNGTRITLSIPIDLDQEVEIC